MTDSSKMAAQLTGYPRKPMSNRLSLRANVGAPLGFRVSAGAWFGSTVIFLAMTKAFPG
jgi:hypothetical protein